MLLENLQLGHYKLLRQIGGGAVGEVYLAEDTRITRQVAVKVVRYEAPSYINKETAKELERLFQREMKAITLLDHPHILPLYDFGEEKREGMIYTYMVMPYRPEGSLADWLRKQGNELLSLAEIAHIVTQAADALQHAHNAQLVHQDIKAANFLIRHRESSPRRPDLLLADFGIARFTTATSTSSQNVRGTPMYMPPEQWDGHPVAATDQYALAVLVYQLLTGQTPFQGGSDQIMRQHFATPPAAPGTLNHNLSPAIDAVILRALAKKPDERFPSITRFAQAFQQATAYSGDLRATLAIRSAEAQTGTSRMLTLPGKRQINVLVPAGTQNGQELHLADQGEEYYEGGPRGTLILTIKFASSEEIIHLNQASDAPTVAGTSSHSYSSHPSYNPYPSFSAETGIPTTPSSQTPAHLRNEAQRYHQSNSITPLTSGNSLPPSSGGYQYPAGQPLPSMPRLSPPNKGRPPGLIVLLVCVIILVIAGSGGMLLYNSIISSSMNESNARATATAENATVTAIANSQQTATATAQIQASTTAQAQATSTARAEATASVVAQNPNPYPPGNRKLVLLDPLQQAGNWEDYTDADFGGSCEFKDGDFHVRQTKSVFYYYCPTYSEEYNNATFEVEMSIFQGDCGGIVFRVTPAQSKLYFFRVCASGSYSLYLYSESSGDSAKILADNTSPAIRTGLSQTNLLAVVTNGNAYDLYANKQKLTTINDATYAQGYFGLVANSLKSPTDVAYSNAKIWA